MTQTLLQTSPTTSATAESIPSPAESGPLGAEDRIILRVTEDQPIEVSVEVVPNEDGSAQFLYDGKSNLVVIVDYGVSFDLVFVLTENSGSYVTYPVNWFTGLVTSAPEPAPEPRQIEVRRSSNRVVRLQDFNETPDRAYFTLTVLQGDRIYTSADPTIINRPDGPVNWQPS